MKRDEHDPQDLSDPSGDPLWELLGKARQPKERPFFVGKVMRAVREDAQPALVSVWAWLRTKWLVPVTVTACAVVAAVTMLQPPVQPGNPGIVISPSTPDSSSDDVDQILEESIDQLLATENSSAWLSADPSSFLP